MKKLAIAGASLALAAMPAVGVFAADPVLKVKDSLTLTVTQSCSYDGVNPSAATTTNGNTYTASASANDLQEFTPSGSPSAATSLTVKCNAPGGYTITPTFSGLDLGGTAGAQSIAYAADSSAGSQTWTAYYAKNGAATPTAFTASGASGAISGTPNAGVNDTYTFSYKVGTGVNQSQGTYTGYAEYTLAPVNN